MTLKYFFFIRPLRFLAAAISKTNLRITRSPTAVAD